MSNEQIGDSEFCSEFKVVDPMFIMRTEQPKLIEEFNRLHKYKDPDEVKSFLDKLMIVIPSKVAIQPAMNLETPTPNTTSLLYKFTPEYDKTGKVLQKVNYSVLDWTTVNSYFTNHFELNDDLLQTTRLATSEYESFLTRITLTGKPNIWVSFDKDSQSANFNLTSTGSVHKHNRGRNSIYLNLSLNGQSILNVNKLTDEFVMIQLKLIIELQNKLHINEFTSSTEFVDNFLFELLDIADASN